MEQSKEMETLAELRPMVVNHNNSKLYDGLRSCMQRNAELQQALLDAAQTIEKLTEALHASKTTEDHGRCC